VRSFLRWAGSKRLTLNVLKASCPNRIEGRYIEPFAGSACLFFDLQPNEAILGDLNRELICAMREIRRDVYRVLECVRRLPRGKTGYYRVRSLSTYQLCEAEIAARFIYLNRYCFNGLYRTNLKGNFNVPYGPPKAGKRRFAPHKAPLHPSNHCACVGSSNGTGVHENGGSLWGKRQDSNGWRFHPGECNL
jgi:DNA adenine methylase